jgi:glycosyltransferase involved in cell wall biosynthesis
MSRIAVLIPVLNQMEDLSRTLQSIDRQSADMEIFVVDDGSEPPVRIDEKAYRYPVHVMSLPQNQGCTAARNIGLKHILEQRFDYVALQDAGDTDIGERMQIQANYLDLHESIAVVGAWARYVDPDGRLLYLYQAPTSSKEIRARMPYVSAFANPATMMRLDALEAVGLYDPDFPIAGDYEIFFRLTRRFETANLSEVLINKEDNPNSLSLGRRRQSLLFRLRAQWKYFTAGSVHSYLGIGWTLILLMFPYSMVVAVKKRRGYAR